LMFVPTIDKGGIFYASSNEPVDSLGETLGGVATPVPNEEAILAVKAIEVTTGKIRWQHAGPPRKTRMEMGGVMSTAGQLVLGGDGELLLALDARTGEELWRFNAGGQIAAAPVSYELAGRQYIAIAAGRSILAFALPKPASSPSHRH
jgi:alcohol dehydrogenase (cytochrome c)